MQEVISISILCYTSPVMDEKTLVILEFTKVLEQLASYASFSASAELAHKLRPSTRLEEVLARQARTREARLLLDTSNVTLGGVHDLRARADLAAHGGVLEGLELLEVKDTLVAARNLGHFFQKNGDTYPNLARIAAVLPPPPGIIDAITRTVSENGEVLDSASPKLSSIRRDLKISYERLMSRLERMINDPKNVPILQEQIITQRNGRYVIPLRAEFKGRIRSIVHDQSSSGATFFVEPLVVVELNNQWHELQLAERDEVRRILAEVSALVGLHAADIAAMVDALADLDLAMMCAQYALAMRANEPLMVEPRPAMQGHPGSIIQLHHARHPLLPDDSVVPIEVDVDDKTFAVVITGPNTGGKTVTLKTVGLMVLMAQSGLHIPVQSGSTLSLFCDVFADIGDEQSIEQSLSTFSGHVTNIVRILRHAGPKTLVLLDELGAGTDPQEGAALARALLGYLIEKRIPCLVATHYPDLKAFAHITPGAVNASMEFDLKTLRPTFHLNIGLPGRSNALLIAERLGMPAEILEVARTALNPLDLHTEDLLDEIHRQRDAALVARQQAEEARKEAEAQRFALVTRLEKIEEERRAVVETARLEAEQQVRDLKAELDEVRRALSRARQPLDGLREVQSQVENLQAQVQAPVEERRVVKDTGRPLQVGDRVRLPGLQLEGVITSLSTEDAEIQAGNLRMRAHIDELKHAGGKSETQQPAPVKIAARRGSSSIAASPLRASPGMDLDLRGQHADDALDAVERFLEKAYLAGMPFVRIIHGRGTGRLREVIRAALKASPHVTHYETGLENEGGDGVTVAHMVEE